MINLNEKNIGEVNVLMDDMHQWGVIDNNGNIIVPFGKYDWIDCFDQGLARVNIRMPQEGNRYATVKKWGIINERGEEVTHCWTLHCTPERRNPAPPTRTLTQASLSKKS